MRVARLHGVEDLRVEALPDPLPAPGELLIEVEGCGICPTDLRKFLIGTSDGYPLNPGHEWVGRVTAVGDRVEGWAEGDRLYGDTYAGYGNRAVLALAGNPWSYGPLRVPDELPLARAVFVEPLADCLHALHDQARLAAGDHVLVVGGGQMGLQMVACAARAGARVSVAEPDQHRRVLAAEFGAGETVAEISGAGRADVVVLTVGAAGLVQPCVDACADGGRIVLFAGFGDVNEATIDVNRIHYREISIVGSEWIGRPPHTRHERYAEALELLVGGLELERLVELTVGLDGIRDAFAAMQARTIMKAMLVP
jgi:L-iditol 2-dehydrogenase